MFFIIFNLNDLRNSSINREFKAFISDEKKKNIKEIKPLNPEDKQIPKKKNILKIKDKLKVVDYIEDGHSIQDAVEKFNIARSTVDKWYKKRDLMRAVKNTDKRTMHPGAQPKYRMKNEILMNLKFLNYLFNEDPEDYEDDYDYKKYKKNNFTYKGIDEDEDEGENEDEEECNNEEEEFEEV